MLLRVEHSCAPVAFEGFGSAAAAVDRSLRDGADAFARAADDTIDPGGGQDRNGSECAERQQADRQAKRASSKEK